MSPHLLEMAILFVIASDVGRKEIGMRFGRYPFAEYITPQMRWEGAVLATLTPLALAFFLSKYKDSIDHGIMKIDL